MPMNIDQQFSDNAHCTHEFFYGTEIAVKCFDDLGTCTYIANLTGMVVRFETRTAEG